MIDRKMLYHSAVVLSFLQQIQGLISPFHETSSPRSRPLEAVPQRYRIERAQQKFLRIRPRNARGSRRLLELQTAVVSMVKTLPNGKNSSIDLHSMIHFGDEEYYSYFNNQDEFKYDNVFYELIVPQKLLHTNPDGSQSLKSVVGPPRNDKNTANSYGLKCQLDVISYTKHNWIHCDTTREEFIETTSTSSNEISSGDLSIWSLASTAAAPFTQYTSALLGPSTPSTVGSELLSVPSLRLFSNLFLEGGSLATLFRLLLWIFSPAPEVSILLLDWSSIVEPKPSGIGFSNVFIPVIESLITGNLSEARKLVFAQLLVSGQTAGGRDVNLVRKRNFITMTKLGKYIEGREGSFAILYGALHCQELQRELQKLGYSISEKNWRTAWTVSVPTLGSVSSGEFQSSQRGYGGKIWGAFAMQNSPDEIAIGLVAVPLYLMIGGYDWLGTLNNLAHCLDGGAFDDGLLIVVFYLMRHIALYLGLAKFAVNWDGEERLFEVED